MGIALSATELCAAESRAGVRRADVRRMALERMSSDNGASWPALADALRELGRAYGGGGRLSIALMGSLAEVRRLELPSMRADDLRQLLTRNAARYFVVARAPQVVGALPGARRAKGELRPVVAAAAPARLIAAVHSAAFDAGWLVESISPAEAAWAHGASQVWASRSPGLLMVLVALNDRTELLEMERGRLVAVRRFRPGAADAALIADAVALSQRRGRAAPTNTQARLAAIGSPSCTNELAAALVAHGIILASPPSEWADIVERPDAAAASFAGPDALPTLESDEVRASNSQQVKGVVRWAVIGAATLFVIAALFELWGARRELSAVQLQRSALREEVAATLVGRTSVETAFRQLAALATAQRSAPRWSTIVAALTDKLGDDAYLTAFRGRGDSVVVDGLASHAARAFDAVDRTPGLARVRAAAPVRREAPSNGPALERFTIAAQVAPRATAARASERLSP